MGLSGLSALCILSYTVGGQKAFSIKGFEWYHALSRGDSDGYLQALMKGPSPNPNPDSVTRANETSLGIVPPCVYFYLGRTCSAFGDVQFVYTHEELAVNGGTVSPFDSGGLTKHHAPVCDWPNDRKQSYLKRFSWPSIQLSQRYQEFPGSIPLSQYASLKYHPHHIGPHVPFGVTNDQFHADIWQRDSGNWRAWAWELRVPSGAVSPEMPVKWCSSTQRMEELKSAASDAFEDQEFEHFLNLLRRWKDSAELELVNFPDRLGDGI